MNEEIKLHQRDEPCDKYNRWNRLVDMLRNSKDEEVRKMAESYLSAMNTAAGPELIGSSADGFIMANKELWVKYISNER